MMETESIDTDLQSALRQVVDGLTDPDAHFTVSANYYDHLTSGRVGERCGAARRYIAQMWLNADTASNVELTQEGLVCDVRLNRHDRNQVSRILLPYSQIWSVQSIHEKHIDLYHRSDKLNLKRPGE
jgi:hypothetical protein